MILGSGQKASLNQGIETELTVKLMRIVGDEIATRRGVGSQAERVERAGLIQGGVAGSRVLTASSSVAQVMVFGPW